MGKEELENFLHPCGDRDFPFDDEVFLSAEPMTDEQFDMYMGMPEGSTRIKREREVFSQMVNLCT
jgi:hypothetical protein